ncbi:MAG: shikimate dehydrogenase [Gammaproteobacteria bacterium]|nr:shikimate dehydrogenase [Gammaproteobacteria bacterium]NVK89349.1 shikimate dehydrogenase [Gammaproteobacteria bacterium]
MKHCAVIGNPIAHSLSPKIHQHFAKAHQISLQYQTILATSDTFSEEVADFFEQQGLGMNVTLPFKQQAFELADRVTPRAELAQSVNTLSLINGRLVGDTTDGAGFITDLDRLKAPYKNANIIILGAGGAARSLIPPLLQHGAQIRLVNRTRANADRLIERFAAVGDIHYFEPNFRPHLVINTLPQNGSACLQSLTLGQLPQVTFYDISYGERAAEFLNFVKQQGAKFCFDGWGMLVEQAALSFALWHQVQPNTDALISAYPGSLK